MKSFYKNLLLSLLLFLVAGTARVQADEGMWLPLLIKRLNYTDMQRKGLKLSAEEIYSANHSSLKDAIVQLGNGCTGEVISEQGLILTNHHCGYGSIQAHSTVNHDYLTDGFWAMTKEEELPNPGFFVKFLIRMEDVTQQALAGVTDAMDEERRAEIIKNNIHDIKEEAVNGTSYEAVVKPFFGGNEYYLFVMQTYRDVRLVGAPPSAIGKFGGDTDNWMWPRHTGDFSLFRVYCAPDGSPAPYSKDNVPLKPKYYLPISLNGVKENDFTMILGYPGSTQRYLSSRGIEHNLNMVYPTRIKIRRKKLDIIGAEMKANPAVRIQYASKYARISNYWKNFIGMSRGLKKLHVIDKKRQQEAEMKKWINAKSERVRKYGSLFNDINKAYAMIDRYTTERYYYYEAIYYGPEALKLAGRFERLEKALSSEHPDTKRIEEIKKSIKAYARKFYKNYDEATDRQLFAAMLSMFHQGVALEQQPAMLKKADARFKGNYEKMANTFYGKSLFSSEERLDAFMDNPSLKRLTKDPLYRMSRAFNENHQRQNEQMQKGRELLNRTERLYIDALRQTLPEKKFYPDANFTMRLTYGQVKGYEAADAVHYKYYTTLEGVMQKEDRGNPEFTVPKKLKEIYEKKDYGLYGEGQRMKVCFLSNTDITGGNSGSPVINGKGELTGLAFDGNWEAMSGDIAFEPELQRTISVDIRYVLLIIDKYAGATHLIDEMKLIGSGVR